MWHTADGQVWRYHQLENGPFRVAAGVIASPPPVARYDDDRVYVFHGDDPADVQVGELSGDGVETLRPERGDARTFRTLPGGGFALVTPGVGLTVVPGLGGVVASVPGRVISVAQAGTDLFVLADGAAFVVGADGVPQPRGDGPFTDLQPAPTGATVLQTAGGQATLYWLHPSANPAGEDTAPVRLAQGPAPLSRLSDYAGHGLWARGAAGWGRTLLPPAAPAVNVDREVTRLLTLDADRTLATTPDGHIVQIDARSGATFEWARNATLLENTGRDFAAYEADRGIFVVPLPDAPNP